MEPFKFLTTNPQVLIYSTVGHKLYGGIGIVNGYPDIDTVYVTWLDYEDFPTDYNYDSPTPINELEILKK